MVATRAVGSGDTIGLPMVLLDHADAIAPAARLLQRLRDQVALVVVRLGLVETVPPAVSSVVESGLGDTVEPPAGEQLGHGDTIAPAAGSQLRLVETVSPALSLVAKLGSRGCRGPRSSTAGLRC
jgi:hypothetical protein